MTPSIRLLAAASTLVLAACGGEPSAADSNPERASEHGAMMAPEPDVPGESDGLFPAPPLQVRIERVLDEVGEVLPTIPRALDRAERRRLLRDVGPRVRASLRRHDVRLVQLARHLNRAGGMR